MIEEIVREHLKTILDVPVLREEENKEKKYILLEKTGGSEWIILNMQHWRSSLFLTRSNSTAKLNEEMKEAMKRITEKRWRLQVRTKQ